MVIPQKINSLKIFFIFNGDKSQIEGAKIYIFFSSAVTFETANREIGGKRDRERKHEIPKFKPNPFVIPHFYHHHHCY